MALAEDQPHYIVEVNVFSVTGETDNPSPINVSAGKWNKVMVDGISCSFASFSYGVAATCNLPTGMDGSVAKCNNTLPGNKDADDSLQVTKKTKLLLKCQTSNDVVK